MGSHDWELNYFKIEKYCYLINQEIMRQHFKQWDLSGELVSFV